MPLAPLPQGGQDDMKLLPLLRQAVLAERASTWSRQGLEGFRLHQFAQPRGGDVLRQPQGLLELPKALGPRKGVPDVPPTKYGCNFKPEGVMLSYGLILKPSGFRRVQGSPRIRNVDGPAGRTWK